MAHLPVHWRERLLHLLMCPFDPQVLRLLTAWQRTEGGAAENNPLNTTYPMPWSTEYNHIGVRNYKTPIEGIGATAATIARDKRYLDLWKDLQEHRLSAEEIVQQNFEAFETWGTDTVLLMKVLKEV